MYDTSKLKVDRLRDRFEHLCNTTYCLFMSLRCIYYVLLIPVYTALLILCVALPFVLWIIYAFILYLYLYKFRHGIDDEDYGERWDNARTHLFKFWSWHGRVWHGYELHGTKNIPSQGPALIIAYHGVSVFDITYMASKYWLEQNRHLYGVGDRAIFKIPGFTLLMGVAHGTTGTIDSCVKTLKDGHLLAIYPGGAREAVFSCTDYVTMWGKRIGFAKIALKANVPVIPMFTQNINESFRTPSFRHWFRSLYEKTRLMIVVPIYGGFPVKLRTYLGEPVIPDLNTTPEKYAHKIEEAVKQLIVTHQRMPCSIIWSLLDRFSSHQIDENDKKAN